ncbi:hypothetical protein [uncultured Aquimonas sp.]|uniref:hypothetical protein n=1 Tax=uncultured Aquimonas sp. TaxID=385483 RepID=UPI0026255C8E|nr:hypothetical protein [uncultured Aquimonas sp.]
MAPLFAHLASYVQAVAGRRVVWGEPTHAALPAYLDRGYAGHWMDVGGEAWLAVLLKGEEPPAPLVLSKQLAQLAERLGTTPERTCLVAEQLPAYLRRRLVELRQTFVIPGRQLFWPSLGSAETVQRPRRLKPEPVAQFSPVAQQLLLALLLGRLPQANTVRLAAQALGYAEMSLSRAVKELEATRMIETRTRGKSRGFALQDSAQATWERAQPLLRSPVLRAICVREESLPTGGLALAGETALAEFSNLAAPSTTVYAACSRHWQRDVPNAIEVPLYDEGCCWVQLWRYAPEPLAERGLVDPLSLQLSLRDEHDVRVQIALDELMEHIPW